MHSSTSDRSASALPRKVLIAVDSSAASQHALAYARNIIAPAGVVRLVSVAENPRTLVPMGSLANNVLDSVRSELLRDATTAVSEASKAFMHCDAHVETEVIDLSKRGDDVVQALLDAAHDWHADLLVVGTRQHQGLQRWVEGNISEPLATRSRCPVLIVPAACEVKIDSWPERILFALDGSRQAIEALHCGIRFATHDAHLRAIYVIDRAVRLSDFVPIDALEDAFVKEGTHVLAVAEPILASASGHSSTALIRTARASDDVAHAITRAAGSWQADLIVMGTHGRRGMIRWMLGSVAGRVAHFAHTPLLLVHVAEA